MAGAAWGKAPVASLRPRLRPSAARKAPARGLDTVIKEANLGGRVTCAVFDLKSGRQLEGFAETSGQPPASVTKAVTALYALETLGPDFRFETTLRATGPVEDGVLQGGSHPCGRWRSDA